MKASHYREQNDEELEQSMLDMRKEIVDYRLQKNAGDASDQPLRIRELKKNLARINTVMRERKLAVSPKTNG